MPSNYASFTVNYENTAGVITNVGAGVSVRVRAEGGGADVAESPLATIANGVIAAGSLASVNVGTKVHFRVEQYLGTANSVSQITT